MMMMMMMAIWRTFGSFKLIFQEIIHKVLSQRRRRRKKRKEEEEEEDDGRGKESDNDSNG